MSVIRTSKYLSLVLRHKPEAARVQMDEAGWVKVADLLKGSQRELDMELLEKVVAENNKKRFEFNEDKTLIRARQGHSIPVSLGYEPLKPPKELFHGTATKNLDAIKEKGLLKMRRHAVHLSADVDTALNVGGRHGKPVVLVVKAQKMWEAGARFYLTNNGVWFTETVPSDYIDFAGAHYADSELPHPHREK